ncbi:arylsulfatase [uncultured Polaribacter sp.]|uniref:arylsulfatase n=1 Tax=uncultured Polaribacter sp. TaxID=174711 RepID=UPI00260E149D|nr:arylsulfatase [uncultured Polaribacter sp.]
MKFKALHLLPFLLLISFCAKKEKHQEKKPNIIYILADDLGYGDLGVYGQKRIETPNLDDLASQGIRFTQHYSGASVCAPSRSSLMTGQHTGHTPIRGNKEFGDGQTPLPANAITIAEILKKEGYVTGMFGKWGLGFGEGDPNNQGFDEFYGYNDQKLAHRYYPPYLNHNQKIDSLSGNDWTKKVTYAPDVIQKKTLEFIQKNKEKSFFAYVPLVLPHAEIISPKDSLFKKYENKFEEVPHTKDSRYTSDYGKDIVPKEYSSQEKPYATFASMVNRMDEYVGQIVKKVEELGIADNTIIMFSSDNGPHTEGGANPKYFNSSGGLRGVKRDLYEGGIRAPFIVSWPSKIKKNSISNHVSAFWDILPTIVEISGAQGNYNSDGISLLPTLLNDRKNQREHEFLYWEFNIRGGRKALRKGKWKAVWYNINSKEKNKGRLELYNLSKDEKETNNVADLHPKIVLEIKNILKKEHSTSKLFPFK